MKKNIFVKLLLATFGLVTLSGCSFFDFNIEIVTSHNTSNTSQQSSGTPIELGEYAGQKITIGQVNKVSSVINLPSTGEQKILVIPFYFSDYDLSVLGLNEEEVKADLEDGFFGSYNDVGWESVKSFYEASSYGKLNISGFVTDIYAMPERMYTVASYTSSNSYYTPSYTVLEKACAWFKETYPDRVKEFDQNKDGYLDGVWLVYLNPYYESEGDYYNFYCRQERISTFPFISKTNEQKLDTIGDFLWAYTYWDYDQKANKNSPNPYTYCFGSYYFTKDGGYEKPDMHTYIHETGHMLGLTDYYNYEFGHRTGHFTSDSTSPCGGLAMMDENVGDHDVFSKYLLDWVNPKIIKEDGEYELGQFESTGECLIIPSNLDEFSDSPFSEYLIIEYYTPDGINLLDSTFEYSNGVREFTERGIKIYHIDARLALYTADRTGEATFSGYSKYFINNSSSYTTLAHSNTPTESVNKNYKLINLISATRPSTTNYYYQDRTKGIAQNKDLFTPTSNQMTSFTFNDGSRLQSKIVVKSLGDKAVIQIGEEKVIEPKSSSDTSES